MSATLIDFSIDAVARRYNLMLVCTTCAHVVVFRADGWDHRDDSTCRSLVVAWPPPLSEDDEPTADAA